jgi:hypothetical protein
MAHAAGAAPAIGREALLQGYNGAFGGLLAGLAALTLALAIASFALLRPRKATAPAEAAASEPCSAH